MAAALTEGDNTKTYFSNDGPRLENSVPIPITKFPPDDFFERQVVHPALVIPAKRTAELRRSLTDLILHRPKVKSVVQAEGDNQSRKLVLKRCDHDDPMERSEIRSLLEGDPRISQSTHTIHLSYQDWTVEEVLKILLPVKEIPSAFEVVGHIAHLNLKDEVLPFRYIVGKVVLDKNKPRIKTVVCKVGQIHSKFRTFGMQVIAGFEGDGWSFVQLKEEGCAFQLDFRAVYWNTRLAGEHRRLVKHIRSTSSGSCIVADMMAGVGPFAVPLACAKFNQDGRIQVHANDLNPESFKYLNKNSEHNRCEKSLKTYNMDGRAFVQHLQDCRVEPDHVIMNLPASAPEFLDAFRGYAGQKLPKIHVYCFGTKDDTAPQQAVERCGKALGIRFLEGGSVRIVRDVAPNKYMFCVQFCLPESVRSVERLKLGGEQPDAKRLKVG